MEGRGSGTQAGAYAAIILLACCPCAIALNPSLDINQYAHNAWTVREGFFKGSIEAIAQTTDGYLWLGSEFGLLRFDGIRSVPWQPPAGEHLPSTLIRGLLAARDGRLWIGTNEGLASWKDGKLTHYAELAGQIVDALIEDHEGTVWASAGEPVGRLCAIQSGSVKCYGADGSLGRWVGSLYEDGRGYLWVGAETGLWRWKPGPPKLYPLEDWVLAMIEGDKGTFLIMTRGGIKQLVDGKTQSYPLRGNGQQFKPHRLLLDHNGGLWIGTEDRGLLHAHQGRMDLFTRSDGLSGDYIDGLFEDREGNIWVATVNGLDRFRDFAVPMISVKQGLSNAVVWSVLAARDGSIWLGTPGGLNRWNNGQITIYSKGSSGLPDDELESLFQDDRGRIWFSSRRGVAYFENDRFIPVSAVPGGQVHSIAEDRAGNLWISQDQSLFHLLRGSSAERILWARLGHQDMALALLPDPLQGGLWLGFFRGGMAYFKDGQVRVSYAGGDALGKGPVAGLQLDRDGTLWAATEGGLSRVKNGRVATLTSKSGLPCDPVHWVVDDDAGSFWLYMACGLVRIAQTELDAWASDPKRTIKATAFDSSDGVRSHASFISGYSPRVAKSTDGKLWFLSGDGVSVIDPRHIPYNNLPPPVHIEEITADRKLRWQNLWGAAASNLRLPALSRDLVIDYTALSFVAPEKIRFRVKLEGHDPDWKDAGTERKAFYNDLPPRKYRFRVKACNNSGVWNEAGASFDFSIDPAYYQTRWFQASCVAAFLGLLWALYRYRLHQIGQEFSARMEERTRIARELHDTLLQSFQGSLLVMQTARNLLSRRPEQAEKTLDNAIHMASGAITDGRDAIHDLRSQPAVQSDLAQLLTATGQDLAHSADGNGNPVIFRVAVEGVRHALDPIVQDEAYRIARELLRNAFRHARASQIEAEIRYEDRLLRVLVRDDGKGIDPEIVKAGGRAGHWGILGIRERATRVGGRLEFWSEAGAGTEVELSIPASIAYAAAPRSGRLPLLRKRKANP
jgi:signal transduction histidine kinase/ligand-binding sensor domain-containing protein